MKELKPCPMKTSEIIKALKACEIEADCTVCPLKDYDQATCIEYLVTQAADRLEE